MTAQLVPARTPTDILMPSNPGKDTKYRLGKFAAWLTASGTAWHAADLATYRDHLLTQGYAASTISAHLSTVRARYAALIRDRDLFYAIVAGRTDDVLKRKAFVDEMVARLRNAIDPAASTVKVKTSQDVADAAHLRLTFAQASHLMAAPGLRSLRGLRDTSLIALMLCTGIREGEAAALEVRDLRQRLGGELALHVREGKGCKERLVPYGELQWVLAVLDKWLETATIGQGPVFRGFYKGNRKLRPGRLSVRAIQYLLHSYPVMVEGKLMTVNPHDLRRTYARRLYEAGVDLVAIQQNLGHADVKTTLGYIGQLSAETRKPPAVYEFNDYFGRYAAFGQNFMMSVLFVHMLASRGNTSGQSIYIAMSKMLGSLLMSVIFFWRYPSSLLMNFLYVATFVFDVIYAAMLYGSFRTVGINPWKP